MMKRRHPPLFTQARAAIEPVLTDLGFRLAEEHYHQQDFGSAYTVYRRRGDEVRLIWDGKESWIDWDYVIDGGTRQRQSGAPINSATEIGKVGRWR
jgi:hypothetical protein